MSLKEGGLPTLKPRILRRFIALSILGVLGPVFFVPSILASSNPRPANAQLFLFILAVSLCSTFSAWFGLLSADAAHLPMPWLRRLDRCPEPPRPSGLLPSLAFGCVFSLGAVSVLRYFHQPNLAGPLWSRLASTVFAAGTLEIVIHLLIMSVTVRLARGRVWTGILVAALFFVVFHGAGLGGQSTALIVSSILLNGIFGVTLGFFYARYGFEYLVLCHAVGHALAVTLA